MTLHTSLFWLTVAGEGNALVTGLPGSGKTSLVRWSLRNIPPQYGVVIYDTAGEFKECDSVGQFPVNLLDLPPQRVVEILEESLASTYGEYPYLFTPAMSELLLRCIERGFKTLSDIRANVLKIAEPHEVDTAYALRRRLAHLDMPQFGKTDVPIQPGRSTCIDLSTLDRVGRIAYVLAHLELTRNARNIIYVIDEAHRFLAFTHRYSLLTDHLRTGRAARRFFILISHSIPRVPPPPRLRQNHDQVSRLGHGRDKDGASQPLRGVGGDARRLRQGPAGAVPRNTAEGDVGPVQNDCAALCAERTRLGGQWTPC